MGFKGGRRQPAWLLKVVFVVATCFAAGLVTAGIVSGAGPLAALSTDTETTSVETTDTTTADPDPGEPEPTETTETETTETETTEETETTPSWSEASEPYLVRFASGTSTQVQAEILAAVGAEDLSYIRALRIHGVLLPGGDSLADSIELLEANAAVASIEPDREREAGATPSDSAYGDQWSLPKIGWDNVFGTVSPSGSARVAILDTGVDGSHPDLDGNVVPGTSILDGSNGLSDPNGHGTAMAGIVAAETNNGTGVAGVGYAGVQVMPVTVLDSDGTGQDSDIIEGVVYAAENDADIILMAFSNPGYSEMLQAAVDYAWEEGAVLVAATGNDGSSTVTFPAGDRGVIGVSNTDSSDALSGSSNYGQTVFLGAPGTGIATTSAGGGTTSISGTSAAAAHVAGAAALIKATSGASNGVVVSRLARNAEPAGSRDQTGNGRLNLDRAVADTSTDSIQPAGADPIGSGGPIVGPYLAAATTAVEIAPAYYPAPSPTTTVREFTVLARITNAPGNGAKCVRVTLPTGYVLQTPTTASLGVGAVGSGANPWTLTDDVASRRVTLTQPAGGNTGLPSSGTTNWARFNVRATTPASSTAAWTVLAADNSACDSNPNTTNAGVRIGAANNFTYTSALISPASVAPGGAAQPFQLRISNNSGGSGDKIIYAGIALPSCFTDPTSVSASTTNGGRPDFSVEARDKFIRLSGGELEKDINPDEFVTVTFTTAASMSCPTGANVFYTSAWKSSTSSSASDTFNITGNHASVTVAAANTAPSIAYNGAPAAANEGETKTFNFTITDPDAGNTFTFVAGYPSCGTGGSLVAGSASINSGTKTGSFQCIFADGPSSPNVEVRVQDNTSLPSNTAAQAVTVANVAPTVTVSGDASVDEGQTRTYTIATVDPGQETFALTAHSCGTGGTEVSGPPTFNSTTGAGSFQCSFPDGPASPSVSATVSDGDGGSDTGTQAVTVANVAPTVVVTGPPAGNYPVAVPIPVTATFTDPGKQDTHTCTVNGNPGVVAYTPPGSGTGTCTGTATPSGGGSFTITVAVRDDDSGIGTSSTTVNALYAIYANERCTGGSGKGFVANGDGFDIDGGIHSNGNVTINGSNFQSGTLSLYRPQSGCSTSFSPSRVNFGPPSPTAPVNVSQQNWPWNPSKSEFPCTFPIKDDYVFNSSNLTIPSGVYCARKTFKINGSNVNGNITVLAPEIVLNGRNINLSAHTNGMLLFAINPATGALSSKELVINGELTVPNAALTGVIHNPGGAVKVNGTVRLHRGFIQGLWVEMNGKNIRMTY